MADILLTAGGSSPTPLPHHHPAASSNEEVQPSPGGGYGGVVLVREKVGIPLSYSLFNHYCHLLPPQDTSHLSTGRTMDHNVDSVLARDPGRWSREVAEGQSIGC